MLTRQTGVWSSVFWKFYGQFQNNSGCGGAAETGGADYL
jgi:hypothetical protein